MKKRLYELDEKLCYWATNDISLHMRNKENINNLQIILKKSGTSAENALYDLLQKYSNSEEKEIKRYVKYFLGTIKQYLPGNLEVYKVENKNDVSIIGTLHMTMVFDYVFFKNSNFIIYAMIGTSE